MISRGYPQQRRSRATRTETKCQASEAKLIDPQPTSDGEAERPAGPASFFLREEIGRIVAKRRGCCLSEASFTTFRYKPLDFSKKNAALIFWFFSIKRKEQRKGQICFLNSIY